MYAQLIAWMTRLAAGIVCFLKGTLLAAFVSAIAGGVIAFFLLAWKAQFDEEAKGAGQR